MNAIKVDPMTDRMVSDLAHSLRRTKKDVVRDAVLALADLHQATLARAIADSTERSAAASGSVAGARLLASAGGDVGALALRDRVTVMRVQLMRLIEHQGGRDPRVVGDLALGAVSETLELLSRPIPTSSGGTHSRRRTSHNA
jgi:predicted transcriptional regulator